MKNIKLNMTNDGLKALMAEPATVAERSSARHSRTSSASDLQDAWQSPNTRRLNLISKAVSSGVSNG